jgi:hypothetical protein
LAVLRWSTLTLADVLKCPFDVVLPWYHGRAGIPEEIGQWLEALADAHEALPMPAGFFQVPIPEPQLTTRSVGERLPDLE